MKKITLFIILFFLFTLQVNALSSTNINFTGIVIDTSPLENNIKADIGISGNFWIGNMSSNLSNEKDFGLVTFDIGNINGAKKVVLLNNQDNTFTFEGYAWSKAIGWIYFGNTGVDGGKVIYNKITGEINGCAWSQNLGWICIDSFYLYTEGQDLDEYTDAMIENENLKYELEIAKLEKLLAEYDANQKIIDKGVIIGENEDDYNNAIIENKDLEIQIENTKIKSLETQYEINEIIIAKGFEPTGNQEKDAILKITYDNAISNNKVLVKKIETAKAESLQNSTNTVINQAISNNGTKTGNNGIETKESVASSKELAEKANEALKIAQKTLDTLKNSKTPDNTKINEAILSLEKAKIDSENANANYQKTLYAYKQTDTYINSKEGKQDLSSRGFEVNVGKINPGNNLGITSGTKTTEVLNMTLGNLIQKMMIGLGSVSLLVMTFGGGYMVVYHGQDELLSKGKGMFTSGIIALIVSLSSYYIVDLLRYIIYSGT